MRDMNILDFARKISMLSIDTPISIEYDRLYGQKSHRWWSCQREHLVVWCLHYSTGGVSIYQHAPSNSAKTMYYHLSRPEIILWLAEALGEESELLLKIISKIKDKHSKTAMSIIRQYISFDRILDLLDKNII